MPRVLVVDNYDSFVFNLVQYLQQLGVAVVVRRNDEIAAAEIADLGVVGVLISPGPGTPAEAGQSIPIARYCIEEAVPLFGVCLGHQAIGEAFGAATVRASELLHGKTSTVHHDGTGVLAGIPSPVTVTRYHSLVVDADQLPPEIIVTGRTEAGLVMALRHVELAVDGVQFHPESVLTEHGHQMLANWLARCGVPVAPDRVADLAAEMTAVRASAWSGSALG